jgi:hypothetical protein
MTDPDDQRRQNRQEKRGSETIHWIFPLLRYPMYTKP